MTRWLVPIVALAGCASPAGPVGHAEAVAAVGDGGAVVLWRADDRGADRIVRLDAAGKRAWDAKLDGLPRLTPPIVVGDLVLVRHHHVTRYGVGSQAVVAFALADGAPRWDVEVAPYQDARGPNGTPVPPSYLDVTPVGDRIVVWFGDEQGRHVVAAILDHDGKVVHRVDGLDDPGAPLVIGARVVTHDGHQAQLLDTAAGTAAVLDVDGRGCASGDDYVALIGSALVAIGPSARRTLADPFHPVGAPEDDQLLVTCGRHGDALVVAMIVPDAAYVVTTDLAGVLRKTIDLKEHELSIDEDAERTSRGAFQGELPRFVPYVAEPESERARLRVVDLEQGTIAWEGPADPLMPMTTLFRAGADWYLALDGEVKRLDGATGEPVAAAIASHDDGVGAVRPTSIAGGRLWLTAPFHGPLDQLAAAALDAATLAPIVSKRIDVTDLTPEARAVLGRE